MPDITIKQIDELERYAGPFQKGQQFFFAGKSLGLSKLGMNAIRMPPHWEHYPEHDHAADGEEELYIPLEGSGTLYSEGQSYPMERGVLIRVGAATKRKIVPGPDGMTLLVERPARLQMIKPPKQSMKPTQHFVISLKTALPRTFVPIIFSTILLSSGCQKKTATTNPSSERKSELHESTKPLQAADLVGYDGTKLRKSVDHIKDANDKHNREMEKMVESGPDQ